MANLEYRIIFSDPDDCATAEILLEDHGCDYDYDSGNRMMISQEGLNTLDEVGLDYNIV